MTWTIFVAHFFAGAFLINAVPHLAQGLSGRAFPSPFASTPGVGLSSPMVNVVWGFINLVIGYLLLHLGAVDRWGFGASALAVGLGGVSIGLLLAWWFGRQRPDAG